MFEAVGVMIDATGRNSEIHWPLVIVACGAVLIGIYAVYIVTMMMLDVALHRQERRLFPRIALGTLISAAERAARRNTCIVCGHASEQEFEICPACGVPIDPEE